MSDQFDYTGIPQVGRRGGMRVIKHDYIRDSSFSDEMGRYIGNFHSWEVITNAYGNGYYNEHSGWLTPEELEVIKQKAKELDILHESP